MNFSFNFFCGFTIEVEVKRFIPAGTVTSCDDGAPAEWDEYKAYFIFECKDKKIKIEFTDDFYELLGERIDTFIIHEGMKIAAEENYIDEDEQKLEGDSI